MDACNTTLGVIVFAAASNMGYGYPVFIAQCATLCNFYLTTWEEYYTGTLYLSWFSGPVEGIILVCGLYGLTGYYGPGFWHAPILGLLSTETIAQLGQKLPSWAFNVNTQDIYLVGAGLGLFFNIYTSAANVIKSQRKAGEPILPVLTHTLPFVSFYSVLLLWVQSSPVLLNSNLILPFMLSVGFSVALSVGRIITAHVSSQKFPVRNVLMLYPVVAYATQWVGVTYWGWDPIKTTSGLVWLGFGSSLATYAMFVTELIVEITEYLDIYCLRIKYPLDSKKDK